MILFRMLGQPKPIDDKMYGCIVLVKAKDTKILFQTFPVEVASAISSEDVWHHVRGKNLALCWENKHLLVKMFTNEAPLSEQEIKEYLEFIARVPKEGELDVKSALRITVDEEIKRLRFGGTSS